MVSCGNHLVITAWAVLLCSPLTLPRTRLSGPASLPPLPPPFVRHLLAPCSTAAVQNKTDTEKKLDEALSKENWGASSTLLKELAQLTFD